MSAMAVPQSCQYFMERVIIYICIYTVFYIVTIPTVYFGLYILNLHDVIESESSVQQLPFVCRPGLVSSY